MVPPSTNGLADHEGQILARQEQVARGFARLAGTRACLDRARGVEFVAADGGDLVRHDRVHADLVRCKLHRRRAREIRDRALGAE
jgi:hypothetical protein